MAYYIGPCGLYTTISIDRTAVLASSKDLAWQSKIVSFSVLYSDVEITLLTQLVFRTTKASISAPTPFHGKRRLYLRPSKMRFGWKL